MLFSPSFTVPFPPPLHQLPIPPLFQSLYSPSYIPFSRTSIPSLIFTSFNYLFLSPYFRPFHLCFSFFQLLFPHLLSQFLPETMLSFILPLTIHNTFISPFTLPFLIPNLFLHESFLMSLSSYCYPYTLFPFASHISRHHPFPLSCIISLLFLSLFILRLLQSLASSVSRRCCFLSLQRHLAWFLFP